MQVCLDILVIRDDRQIYCSSPSYAKGKTENGTFGMSNQGETNDTLDHKSCLAQYTPGGTGGSDWGEDGVGFPDKTAAPTTQTQVSG